MIFTLTGQIDHVYDMELYDKKRDKWKRTIILSQKNSLMANRTEYVPFDFMDEDAKLISDLCIACGDVVEVSFELRGRKYVKQEEPEKPLVYANNQGISIKVISA